MLSDRFWFLKLALAAGLFAFLCRWAQSDISSVEPDVETALYDFEHVRGKPVYMWAKQVLTKQEGRFTVGTRVGPFEVLSPLQPQVGDHVIVVGRITGPRTVTAHGARVMDGYLWKRPLNYGLSAVTLVVYLWLIRRRFRWTPERGLFRGRF